MLYTLPRELLDKVLEFAGTDAYWKRRFTNDVLAEIDQGIVFVGWDSKNGIILPCTICYMNRKNHQSFGCSDSAFHVDWRYVTFEDMRRLLPRSIFFVRGISLQAFRWLIVRRGIVHFHKTRSAIKNGIAK